jgi:phage terminase large subunit-like protein
MLRYKWRGWRARPNQLAPEGNWRVWLILAGRGFGKTRSGAEWVREQVERQRCGRIALVAETAADARNVMVEGESGILAISRPDCRPVYEPSKRRLQWPNGAVATTYAGDEPDQLRGPQHDAAWADEPAKWKYPTLAWDNMELGLRLGPDPRIVATTTPRPIPLLRELIRDPMTVVTRGSTYDNLPNLAPGFIDRVLKKYEGTRLGRQELHAELLEDVPGALWTRKLIEASRVPVFPSELRRVVVAVDPAVSSGEESNETGIIVAGVAANGHGYVLEDLSGRLSPDGWARQAVRAYHYYRADRIVGEVNNGGDLIENVLRTVDPQVSYRSVHASRGKYLRAEPIAALYEQGRIHHVGMFAELEDQLCSFVPNEFNGSPDRLDAAVWALTDLFLEPEEIRGVLIYEDRTSISPF